MLGLSLSGGGARGAYQAGVILGLSEILDPLSSTSDPFGYYSGNSAGSINTTYCAAGTIDLQTTSRNLADLWSNLNPEMVYKTDQNDSELSHSHLLLKYFTCFYPFLHCCEDPT